MRAHAGWRARRVVTALLLVAVATIGAGSGQVASAAFELQRGVVLVSLNDGRIDVYGSDGKLQGQVATPSTGSRPEGMCFSPAGHLYVADSGTGTTREFSSTGELLRDPLTVRRVVDDPSGCAVDRDGNIDMGSFASIVKVDQNGSALASYRMDQKAGDFDLAADGCTLFYLAASTVKRFDACAGRPLADFAPLPASQDCQGIRIRPNADVMIACAGVVVRRDSAGAEVQQYSVGDAAGQGNVPRDLSHIALDPDGTSFWAGGGPGTVARIDLNTGTILSSFSVVENASKSSVGGISVVGEPTSFGGGMCATAPGCFVDTTRAALAAVSIALVLTCLAFLTWSRRVAPLAPREDEPSREPPEVVRASIEVSQSAEGVITIRFGAAIAGEPSGRSRGRIHRLGVVDGTVRYLATRDVAYEVTGLETDPGGSVRLCLQRPPSTKPEKCYEISRTTPGRCTDGVAVRLEGVDMVPRTRRVTGFIMHRLRSTEARTVTSDAVDIEREGEFLVHATLPPGSPPVRHPAPPSPSVGAHTATGSIPAVPAGGVPLPSTSPTPGAPQRRRSVPSVAAPNPAPAVASPTHAGAHRRASYALLSPDGRYWWDGRTWVDAEVRIPPRAKRSPDGAYWWDGQSWRAVPGRTPGQVPPR
jgi:streptogramin lyase